MKLSTNKDKSILVTISYQVIAFIEAYELIYLFIY